MHARTLLLTSAVLLLLSPTVAATDGTSVEGSDDCGIICCFQDNVVDRAQCTGDFFVTAGAQDLPGRTGHTVLVVWAAGNTAVDNAQADAGDILCTAVTCPTLPLDALQASQPDLPRIYCADDPLGWTACFVLGIAIGPSYWCTGKPSVDYAQCVANGEVDHAQAYEQRMCDHVFRPWVCDASPVTLDQNAAALPPTAQLLLEDVPCICCYNSLAETAQCFADLAVRGAVPDNGVGAVVIGYWDATMGAYDTIVQPPADFAQEYVASLISTQDVTA